ncbi:MAG: hypothetical protein H7282_12855 [Cytophagaceae bacterium]|nr:hypothetical protein [Cytophagaceae bacterium]
MNYTLLIFLILSFARSETLLPKPVNAVNEYTILLQDSSGTISFYDKGLKGACTLKLYNPEGKLIMQDVVNALRHLVFIHAKELKRGIYTVEVINNGKSYWQKTEVK